MKNRKKTSPFFYFFSSVLVIILILIIDYRSIPKYLYTYLGKGAREKTPEITAGVTVTQEIPYDGSDEGVSFQFATNNHRITGDVSIHAVGKTNNFVYIDQTIPGKQFRNNNFIDFFYPENTPKEQETIAVTFTATSETGTGVMLLTSGDDSLPEMGFIFNGIERSDDAMGRRLKFAKSYYFPIFIAGLMIIFSGIIVMILRKGMIPLEKLYFISTLFLGVLFMFIMTPLSIPDELYHYNNAYNLSHTITPFAEINDLTDARYFDFHKLAPHNNVRSAYDRFMNEIVTPLNGSEKKYVDVPQKTFAYPIVYLPQAIGISFGRLLHSNFLVTFYSGRLFNLLFFISCVYFAIKNTPVFKLLFFLLGMMPMALHQAASYSYDTFSNGLSILLVALILKLASNDTPLSIKELFPVFIVGTILCPAKIVYAPLLLLFFIIPVKRFGSLKKFFATILGILAIAVIFSLYIQISPFSIVVSNAEQESEYAIDNSESDNYSLSYMLKYPKRTANIYYNTIIANEYWFHYLKQAIGITFSGLTLSVKEWHSIVFIFLLLLASFPYEFQKCIITTKKRLLFLLISAMVIFATMSVMFISWTPASSSYIQGLQGRYFIPILPLLSMCFNNELIFIRKPIDKVLISMGVIINLSILNQIIITTLHL